MKLLLASLLCGMASAVLPIYGKQKVTKVDNIAADSPLGAKILSQARKLENEEEIDFTWVSGFSIKFQGCHHVSQWNDDADGEEEVRIQTKRLIRFRLCPTYYCSASSASGCGSEYGDYIIDMNTFLETYYEAVENYNEYRCEYTATMLCDCQDDDGKGDDFDRDICEYECFVSHNIVDLCDVQNPYNDDQAEEEEQFNLADYVECQQAEFQQENDEQRKLEEGEQQQEEEEEEVQYFMGPYLSLIHI